MQLPDPHLDRIALEDAAELLQVRGEGSIGAAVAVRKRAAADGAAVQLGHDAGELDAEARLADTGLPEDGDQVRPSLLDGSLPDSAQCLELTNATDERPA